MGHAKVQSSPMEANINDILVITPKEYEPVLSDITTCKLNPWRLLYLRVKTRPQIAFDVRKSITSGRTSPRVMKRKTGL